MEELFSATKIKELLDQYLENDFAARDYDAGVRKLYEAVFAQICEAYHSNVTIQDGIAAYEAFKQGEGAEEIDLSKLSINGLLDLQQRIHAEIRQRIEAAGIE